MRVLVTGATGLIGSAIVARLRSEGHAVLGVARRRPAPDVDGLTWAERDFRKALDPNDWTPLLDGVDAVVNCAGVLQDSARDSTAATHRDGPAALFKACEIAGVGRVIQISAIGIDDAAPSAFSQTKREGDAILMASPLDWVVLRPSVVFGRGAYGGSALIRGLAVLPVAIDPPDARPIQPVMLDDVAETVSKCLSPGVASHMVLDMPGPEPMSFTNTVALYRRWLGLSPAVRLALPRPLLAIGWRLGDVAGLLGWRSPVRTTARLELMRGNTGDPRPWTAATGVTPKSLAQALAAEPASVQEVWFARLYLLKPLIFAAFSLFWLATGILSLTIGYRPAVDLLRHGGLGDYAPAALILGAVFDVAIGLGIAIRRLAKPALVGAMAVSLSYLLLGTILLPDLSIDPLGPLLKIVPILMLNLIALAILDDR